jgi:fructokinase
MKLWKGFHFYWSDCMKKSLLQLKDAANDILLIGEILVDEIRDGDLVKSYFGGSPANITINLKRLGCNPVLLAALGDDSNADFLHSFLVKEGLNTDFIYRSTVTTSKVLLNKSEDSPTPYFIRGSDHLIHFNRNVEEQLIDSKILHFSYWPLSLNPSKDAVLDAIKVAKKHNVKIGFDPNYHADLYMKDGFSIADVVELIKQVDIMKPSLDDAKRLFGDGLEVEEYLNMFRNLGVSVVVMTLGKDGLIASYDDTIVRYPSYAKVVVDSTGAGDAFWSGLYTGLIKGLSIDKSIKLGLACSAYNLKHVGALSDLPEYDNLIMEYNI